MNRKIYLFVLLLLLYNSASGQGFLKTEGKKIVKGNGEELIFKGIGLGGWLVPEGYMLHTSGFANSPTEIRQKIESLIGTEKTDNFFQAYRANYVKRADIEKIAEWRFNSVRLPFHYNILTPTDQPGVYSEEGFAIIDSLLDWCKDNEIYLILDMHCAPGGQNDGGISDYDPTKPSLWEDAQNRARTVDIWKHIAERYKDETWIGGYDLLNEPNWDLGPVNQMLKDLYLDITNAIRGVDTNHIIYIEGNWYATSFNGLTPPWDDNMVYSFHKYWSVNNSYALQDYLNIRTSFNVPLWLGETGENSNSWFLDLVELLQENNIGWAWWPHKKIDNIAGPLSAPRTQQYQQLLDYWNGQAPKPNESFAYAALLDMAAKLAIEECTFQPDVIDALFRQVDNSTTIPWMENQIPGRIYGVNYDLGRRGAAYQDKDYENTQGPGGAVWNSGWTYRNDGVDIEKCSDVYTNGFNVGWIDTGDWLNFTVDVLYEGTYDINLRAAAQNSGGKILLRVDNTNITNFIDVPVTGGWQNWTTITLENIFLNKEIHSLSINFFLGGFNFNYIEFFPNTVGEIENLNTPFTFNIHQNYPNPFNTTTTIKYSIPDVGNVGARRALPVKIVIFDVLGNEVSTPVNENKEPGYYEVKFDASNLPSGLYIYRINVGDEYRAVKKMLLLK